MKIVSELIACSLSAAVVAVVHLSLHAVVGVIGAEEVVDVVLPATTTTTLSQQQQGAIETTPDDRMLEKVENNRIVGGNPVKPGDYPYYVNLNGCGGSLIAPTIVYTAAHCEPKRYINADVGVGVSSMNSLNNGNFKGGENIRVMKAESHPQYKDINNDFALLLLETPYVIESNIKLVLNDQGSVPEDGQYLNVIGLGVTSEGGSQSNKLLEVQVPTVSNEVCNSQPYYNGEVTDEMLCAGFPQGKKDSCQGDSGGPLVQVVGSTHYQVGVVSWGEGCAQPNRPGVYARTSNSIDWIQNIVCDKWNVQGSGLCDDDDNDNSNNPQPPVSEPTPPPVPSPSGDCSNQIQIKFKFDFFSEDISWDIVNKRTQEVVAGKSYRDEKDQATENVDVCDGECYIVTIDDGYGDGMCCKEGKGSYKMKLDGKVVAEGGKFGSKVTKEICVGGGGGNDNDNDNNGGGGNPPPIITVDPKFKIEFYFDDFSEDNSFRIKSGSNWFTENYQYGRNKEYKSETINLDPGKCYTVYIKDANKDGMCCSDGDGFYVIAINGNREFTRDNFGKKATHDFCIDNDGLMETNNNKNNCRDDSEFNFKDTGNTCSWANSKKRCKKKDSDGKKVHKKCKISCGKC
mmetsp:Transcript_26973/g.30316  ORF Transcript_26973/g.30316 Transcript_26973/m.30316 type:complete len:627 (+) Transcript_26973:280-2160(+)